MTLSIFNYISVLVPLAILWLLPLYLRRYGFAREEHYRWLLYVACLLFFVSWYLPSPLIDGQDTSFVTHVVGGGIFTGLLWWYLKLAIGWKAHWLVESFALFALVSALGSINELAELFMVKTGIANILLDDTSWDILANTVGAAAVYLVYVVSQSKKS